MKTLVNTTLCYIEKDGCYLMLHRTKKENDYNHDKWIGIGGKFENGEGPEDCAIREVREETGLEISPEDLRYCGIVTFVDKTVVEPVETTFNGYTEFMHVFHATKFSGKLIEDCSEGDLEWVPISKLSELPQWEADEIFEKFVIEKKPFFSLKVIYKNNKLIETYLSGVKFSSN